MKVEINGEAVDLKGAETAEEISEVLFQRIVEMGGDPSTIQPMLPDDCTPCDDPTIVTLTTSFNKASYN